MRYVIVLLLCLSGLAGASPLVSKVVQRLPSPDGRWTALQRNSWERWGPGSAYPLRCEILLSGPGGERKLHEFVLTNKNRRQHVSLAGWDGPNLLVIRREAPFRRMSEDAVSSLRSCLWLMSSRAGTAARPWKRGVVQAGGIMDVSSGRVCLGLDGEAGGGAGYPPYLAWKTLLITDLEGGEVRRFTNVEAMDGAGVGHCLSPDARFVATYTVAPSVNVAALVVRAVDGRLERRLENAGPFHWTGNATLRLGDPPRSYDVLKGH